LGCRWQFTALTSDPLADGDPGTPPPVLPFGRHPSVLWSSTRPPPTTVSGLHPVTHIHNVKTSQPCGIAVDT